MHLLFGASSEFEFELGLFVISFLLFQKLRTTCVSKQNEFRFKEKENMRNNWVEFPLHIVDSFHCVQLESNLRIQNWHNERSHTKENLRKKNFSESNFHPFFSRRRKRRKNSGYQAAANRDKSKRIFLLGNFSLWFEMKHFKIIKRRLPSHSRMEWKFSRCSFLSRNQKLHSFLMLNCWRADELMRRKCSGANDVVTRAENCGELCFARAESVDEKGFRVLRLWEAKRQGRRRC